MEGSIIALMLLLGIGLMAWRLIQGQQAPERAAVDELLGPLPEGDAREAELTDSAESARAASRGMASTPTGAYGTGGGAGDTASQHWGGAGSSPSFADATPASSGMLDRLADSAGTKLGLAAGAGATIGLGFLVVSRRRARRRRRIERLRQRARRLMSVATAALFMARDRASALPSGLPVDLDQRTSAGGGVALLATLGLLAAIRGRHERQTRAAEADEALRRAAEAAEAASRRGWRGFRRRAATLATETGEVAVPAVSRQVDRAPRWSPAILTASIAVVLLVMRAVRRRVGVGAAS